MLKFFPCLLALSGCGAFLMDTEDFVPRSPTPRCTVSPSPGSLYANDRFTISLINPDTGTIHQIRY